MTTEYDVPYDFWYSVQGQIPWAVAVESGQCDLLLIAYLGIDFQNKGERVYRLLDCELTFMDDVAMEGDTLRYDISINSYAQSGDCFLFFFSYNCYVGDKLVLKMRNGSRPRPKAFARIVIVELFPQPNARLLNDFVCIGPIWHKR